MTRSLPRGPFVADEWVESTESVDVINPATEELLTTISFATSAVVDSALKAAETAFPAWRATPGWERSEILRRIATTLRERSAELAEVLTMEQGKPLAQALWEVLASADQFDWYADEARRIYGRTLDGRVPNERIMVRKEPVGAVAAFASWNFPMLLAARKVAPAIAAGCVVIVSPAIEAPLSTLLMAEACRDAGLPTGVLGVTPGNSSKVSEQLIASPLIRRISLTGSVPVGRILLEKAAQSVTAASMELGGHAPVIIHADADVDDAVTQAVAQKFRNAGQVCASPSRFFVHQSLGEVFAERFAAAASRITVGDGLDPRTEMGPLTNLRRLEASEALVADAVARGGSILTGGHRPEGGRGFFFAPTVIADTPDDALIMSEEPFAPVAPVTTFSSFDEVIGRANSTSVGLASYVFTRDLSLAIRTSEALEVGMVGINSMALAAAEAPFGGIKDSGFGREGGSEGIEDYLVTKYIKTSF